MHVNAPFSPLLIPNLISFWDFQESSGQARDSKGSYSYQLLEGKGPIQRVEGGIFGAYAAHIKKGQWFNILRESCPQLDIHGAQQISIVAWVQRQRKFPSQCEAIAGMWNESRNERQYCLFLNLPIWKSRDQVGGHVSPTGAPTPGHRYCMEAAIGASKVPHKIWQCVAMSYDGALIQVYLNGQLDLRSGQNPYPMTQGIYHPSSGGSDFTVGAVSRRGSMGNWFTGVLGGLAVYNRALTDLEMKTLGSNINNLEYGRYTRT